MTRLLPPRRKPAKSGIERAPQRIWLRHRKFVRSHCCCVPGCQASEVQFAHIRSAANAGTGIKPHDQFGVPLCFLHHQEQHQCGQGTFGDRHGIDLWAIAAELVRRSPDARMRLSLIEEGLDSPTIPIVTERRYRISEPAVVPIQTIPILGFVS